MSFFFVTQYEIIHKLELRMLFLIGYEICNFLLFMFGYNGFFIYQDTAFWGKSDSRVSKTKKKERKVYISV